jgi:hypothetical protein
MSVKNIDEDILKIDLDEHKKDISKHKSNKICAPHIKFDGISCISLNILIKMANKYNESYKDKITLSPNLEILNPQKYKTYLTKELQTRVTKITEGRCEKHNCWDDTQFISELETQTKREYTLYTFKPKSPNGQFEWLSTIDINKVMNQYEKKYPEFKFMGAVPMDFKEIGLPVGKMNYEKMMNDGKTKIGIIFNLDNHDQGGSHWVALYTDLKKQQIYFSDSVGIKPHKNVRSLMRSIANFMKGQYNSKTNELDIQCNETKHQQKDTECGVYSINFIIRLLNGKSFEEITTNIMRDDNMNKCRNEYFTQISD